jgi:N utilization substance protein B
LSAARRASRQAALQVLYAAEVAGRGAGGLGRARVQEALEAVAANFELPEGARAFAGELALGVAERRAEIDALLAAHARHWRVERMAAVDRNLLRIAVWELLDDRTPASVVIDEAVELARRFGSERSPSFVNGVLDGVARALAEGRPGEPGCAGAAAPAAEGGDAP